MTRETLASLCADHLRHEEALLAKTLPVARAVKAAFSARGLDALAETMARQQDFVLLLDEMKTRRSRLREQLAAMLTTLTPNPSARGRGEQSLTLSHALGCLPAAARDPLQIAAGRVRAMVEEMVSLNHWIAVHLHIYLGAWNGLLRGLTGTEASSGRYGPAGKPEANDYRPMLQIRG